MNKCRFCCNLIPSCSGNPYCVEKGKELSESYTKRYKNCDDYILADHMEDEYIDYYMEVKYKPRKGTI